MSTVHKSFLGLLLLILLFGMGYAHAGKKASRDNTWQDAARKGGLSEKDIHTLEENKILITNQAYKQIFTAYLAGGNPRFITSDSLLNAYHVLYEESIFRLEKRLSFRLPGILDTILKNLDQMDDHLTGRPELAAAAKNRAMMIPGIARKLMDDSFSFKDNRLNRILDQEVKKIIAAKGTGMPKWLGTPDRTFTAIDYSRYKPRGFYSRSENLGKYFRAVSWLQSIPFRIEEDIELLAVLMLGGSIRTGSANSLEGEREVDLFFHIYRSFIGAGDDWDLLTAAREVQGKLKMDLDAGELDKKRKRLKRKARKYGKGPLINDQLRFAPESHEGISEPNFRIVPAHRIPSAVMFQRTTDPRKFDRPYPNGLEVPISLGSSFARNIFKERRKDKILAVIDSCQAFYHGEGLHAKYLDVLRSLLDAPEPDAPDFMQHGPWQAKACNTALAGWAQFRHTWALQAKQTVHYLGMGMVPEGFVEPEPDFFSRMADLAEEGGLMLRRAGAFDTDLKEITGQFKKFRSILQKAGDEEGFDEIFYKLPREEAMALELPFLLTQPLSSGTKRDSRAEFPRKIKTLSDMIQDMKDGKVDHHPRLAAMIGEYTHDLEKLWERLGRVSRRLEAIAHKQLRGKKPNKSENTFLKSYGTTIAGIMLYGGNSYLTPRDDAPKVVDIHSNPRKGEYFHVGVARPRKLYVLYPWQGKSILCQGAVMPYYEFVSPSRMTDKTWIQNLDSANRPSLPPWMFRATGGQDLPMPELK